MIKQFLSRWDERKHIAEAAFTAQHPETYRAIVKTAVCVLAGEDEYDDEAPDPDRITEINEGEYQGTLVYVVGAKGYQPSTYWGVSVGYGSCSGCDTLQRIHDYDTDTAPTSDQVAQYMALAFDVVRGFKQICGYTWQETTEGNVVTATQTPSVSPTAAVVPITLPLTPLEFGVVVALAGIGLSAMTENLEMARQYREILSAPGAEDVAFSAFTALVGTMETMTGEVAL